MRRLLRAPLAVLAGGAAASVALDAAIERHGPPPVPVLAAADWAAHLVAAALILRTLPQPVAERFGAPALVAAIAIDADHVPLAAAMLRGEDPPRPRPHTFLSPAAIVAAGVVAPRRHRVAVVGAGLGVALHLVRDLFNGPGVAVAWPLSEKQVRLPVVAEAVVLAGVVALAARR